MTDVPGSHQRPTLATTVQLVAINLRDLKWTMPEVQIPPNLPIRFEPTFALQLGHADGQVAYRITLTLNGAVDVEGDETVIFEMSAALQALFAVPSDLSFDEDDFGRFGELSVLPMTYPYFRQLVSSMSSQAGFLGILLPPLPYGVPFNRQLNNTDDQPKED